MDDFIGLVGDALFVGDQDDRHSGVVYLAQQIHHFLRGFAVQGAGRFVGEDDLGPGNQRAGDRDALFLSAGHFVRHVVGPVAQPQRFEVVERYGIPFFTRHPLVIERQRDVFHCIFVIDQVEGLEDESDHPVPVFGRFRFARIFDQRAVQVVTARVVIVEDAQNVQQGRLA